MSRVPSYLRGPTYGVGNRPVLTHLALRPTETPALTALAPRCGGVRRWGARRARVPRRPQAAARWPSPWASALALAGFFVAFRWAGLRAGAERSISRANPVTSWFTRRIAL
jgi:hypothetical protein